MMIEINRVLRGRRISPRDFINGDDVSKKKKEEEGEKQLNNASWVD